MTLKAESIQTSRMMVNTKTRRVVPLPRHGREREKEGCDWEGDTGGSPKVHLVGFFF